MVRLNSNTQKVDTVFVMLLFVLFAVTTFVLILMGVKQYQVTADTMGDNYQIRTSTSYLVEKVRQNDNDQGIQIAQLDGTTALALRSKIDDVTYITYIYYYDGYLRELFVSEDSVYTLETGQEIIELEDFKINYTQNGHIEVTIYAQNGTSRSFYLATKSTS